MNSKQFEDILSKRLDSIKNTLSSKSKEYASFDDRLYNFKRAAQLQNVTPQAALLGMMTKHLVSVLDLIEGKSTPSISIIDEKIGDTINYFILLEAVLKEQPKE